MLGADDPVRLRMNRTKEHLDAIGNITEPYQERNAHRLTYHPKDNGAKHVVRLHILETLDDPGLPLLIGDFLHNARSTIDNLLWRIAELQGTPSKQTLFPIFTTHSEWIAGAGPHVKGVSVRAQALVRSLQPYRDGNDAADHPLWLLKQLSNWDKHRGLAVVGAGTFASGYGFIGEWDDPNRAQVFLEPGPVKDGAKIATVVPPVPTPKVDMNLTAHIAAIFEEGPFPNRLVIHALRRICRYVDETVIPTLDPLLP